jgi:RNA polymerase sigma-70 factor (ECF subfamily)
MKNIGNPPFRMSVSIVSLENARSSAVVTLYSRVEKDLSQLSRRGVLLDVDDAEILAGLRRSDPAALGHAYAKYRARVYAFLLRLSGRREVADDLLHDTWIKLARAAPRLREDTTLLSWLFTVARNEFTSYRRWALLDVTRLLSFGAEQLDEVLSPEEHAEGAARLASLERALLALPAASREVLLLVAVEGIEQEEVARILGISYVALRQRLSRARAELAQHVSRTSRPKEMKRAPERGAT